MTAIPENPDALLRRSQTAAALTEAGFPVAISTLSSKATRGGGPPYRTFGRKVLYRWADTLSWAQGRCTEARIGASKRSARIISADPPKKEARH